jgi:hypothetical protein
VEYNEENGITPQSIIKPIDMSLVAIAEGDYVTVPLEFVCLDCRCCESATRCPSVR